MAQKFTYPSTRKITLGARLKIAVLPFNVRTPIIYTITLTRNFNSNTSNGIIYLKSDQPCFLAAETVLTFLGITITVAEEQLVDINETPVSIIDLAPGFAIPLNSATTTNALLTVYGCKGFTLTPEIQTTDTTNVSHGIEKEEKQTFISKKISINVVEIYNDSGGASLTILWENSGFRNSEFFFNYSYPDGSFKEGVAIITNVSPSTNQQSLRSFRLEARVQPGTYNFVTV